MYSPTDFFIWFGLIILFLQTYKDYKKRKIDSRFNFFMKGIVITLVLFFTADYLIYLGFLVVAFLFNFLVFKGYGAGDKEILLWVLPGFVLISFFAPIIFLIILIVLTVIENVLALRLTKEKVFFPGTILILISFVLTMVLGWI